MLTNLSWCCLPFSICSDAEKGAAVKDVTILDIPTKDAANASPAAEGVKPPSTFKAVRNVIQESTIWKVLNYGMNYDIHKVCVSSPRVCVCCPHQWFSALRGTP
jgi:hypothetical protein